MRRKSRPLLAAENRLAPPSQIGSTHTFLPRSCFLNPPQYTLLPTSPSPSMYAPTTFYEALWSLLTFSQLN